MTARTVRPARRLRGTIAVPGDKSISHRAAILNAIAEGDAVVQNFLPGEDCRSTLAVLHALGADVELTGDTELRVRGRGLRGLREADGVLDCGNSGTTMRLMAGLLAGQPFLSVLTGDASLRSRPMARVAEPLRTMGATVDGRHDGALAPLAVRGGNLRGISYRSPVTSAQVKSALLLAALYAEGETTVEEPERTRDHTERMLAAMGADIASEGAVARLRPGRTLAPLSMRVPNDISAAAFWMVAASVHPDAELLLTGVGMNPTRTGIIEILRAMGGSLEVLEERSAGGEPVADIRVRSAELHGTEVAGALVTRAIDELPAVAVAAAYARGETSVRDAAELRVKESDRIATVAEQLRALGASVEERADGFAMNGGRLKGGHVRAGNDHRLAMALAVAALAADDGVLIEGAEVAAVSYPGFWDDLAIVTGDDGA